MKREKGKVRCNDIISKKIIIILKSNLRETGLVLAPGTCRKRGMSAGRESVV